MTIFSKNYKATGLDIACLEQDLTIEQFSDNKEGVFLLRRIVLNIGPPPPIQQQAVISSKQYYIASSLWKEKYADIEASLIDKDTIYISRYVLEITIKL